MTSLISPSQKAKAAVDVNSLTSLREAISNETKQTLAHHIDSLRSQPSPASLQPDIATSTVEKSLSERLFDALAGVKILTAQVAMHLDRTWRDKLFRQMDSLLDPAEWETGDEPIQQSSFATFLKAILSIDPARRPGLGLSHSGHLIAAWSAGRDHLTIEFLPDDRVRWVLTRYRDDEPDRFAGQTLVARLAEGLGPHNPERWFSDEGQGIESA
jgi:hypothetical protein